MVVVVLACLAGPLAAAPDRGIALQGTRNTRDLGGLPAEGGTVRPGMVYRSGALCFLSDADVEKLQGLRLATLIELRVDAEIQRDGPDRMSLQVPVHLHLPMAQTRGNGAEAYAGYLEESRRALRDFFAVLAEPASYPVLFHCSAGKDRTGILTALLLMALGTPREAILDDYMQSVRNSPNLVVHPEWLQVVFDTVDRGGGIGPWLEGVGVPPEHLAAVRRSLIVPAANP